MRLTPKNQSGFSIIEALLILLIIAIIGGAAYYVGTQRKDDSKDNSVSAAGQKATTNDSPDPTAGWKTYTNSNAGYTLKLPKDWAFKKGQPMKDDQDKLVTDYQGNPVISPDTIMPISESDQSLNGITEVWADASTLPPKDYFENNGIGRANDLASGDTSIINGYSAYTAHMTGETTYTVVTIAHGGKVAEFLYHPSEHGNKNAATCEQIIKTIKFTNE